MSDTAGETPIFTKTFDFLIWLIPQTNHFPRTQRYAVTRRLIDAALNFLEKLVEANSNRGKWRMQHLQAADAELQKVRLYLRLAHQWKWLNTGQYEHGARMVAEIGRLLGGWQRVSRQEPVSVS